LGAHLQFFGLDQMKWHPVLIFKKKHTRHDLLERSQLVINPTIVLSGASDYPDAA